MKKIAGLCLIGFLGICVLTVCEGYASDMTPEKAFEEYAKKNFNGGQNVIGSKYWFYDIDRDGISEMLYDEYSGGSYGASQLYVYGYQDGKVVNICGEGILKRSLYAYPERKAIAYTSGSGVDYEEFCICEIVGGRLVTTSTWVEDAGHKDGDRRKAYYTYNGSPTTPEDYYVHKASIEALESMPRDGIKSGEGALNIRWEADLSGDDPINGAAGWKAIWDQNPNVGEYSYSFSFIYPVYGEPGAYAFINTGEMHGTTSKNYASVFAQNQFDILFEVNQTKDSNGNPIDGRYGSSYLPEPQATQMYNQALKAAGN